MFQSLKMDTIKLNTTPLWYKDMQRCCYLHKFNPVPSVRGLLKQANDRTVEYLCNICVMDMIVWFEGFKQAISWLPVNQSLKSCDGTDIGQLSLWNSCTLLGSCVCLILFSIIFLEKLNLNIFKRFVKGWKLTKRLELWIAVVK